MSIASQDRSATLNLLFHGIGVPGPNVASSDAPYFVSKELLLAVLDEISQNPRISVSFDDGYASDVEVALPALAERGLSARFFPLAGELGQPGRVDADGLRELVRAGMTVGSHGMRHRSWRRMPPGDAREELVEARRLLSRITSAPVDTAACPFGEYDRSALAALRGEGYSAVFTSDRRRARAGAWLQPRYSVRSGDSLRTVREQILAAPSVPERLSGTLKARLKSWR
jgi:peptidoglycan/xylan/chitin deacetylase (PgdA/CDA1 family)